MRAPTLARLGLLALAGSLLAQPEGASASLKYDLRVTGGGKVAFVSALGQVVSLDLYAQVTGAAGDARVEGYQDGYGSAISSQGGNITGSISSSLVPTFAASGAQGGRQQTLDGDTDFDLGSNQTVHNTDFYFARAASMQTSGSPIANGTEFKLATFFFTVQSVNDFSSMSPVTVNFAVPVFSKGLDIEALWMQDGTATNSNGLGGGTQPLIGSDVSITAVPEPSTAALCGFSLLTLAFGRRRSSATLKGERAGRS